MEFVRQAWLKDINEMKEHDEQDMEVDTISELDVTMSDVRSEFSEYSTISRSLFGMIDDANIQPSKETRIKIKF
ncbi:unnamed protein product [Brugia pahangi]|uniref:Movement protein n=1 Tax=Brugia pahangi TaxID=6280 RepID=A0A0N4TAG9_BRUPA|nr:unnamed protein product [Brugia pahangi]